VEEVALDDLPEIDSEYWFDDLERPTVRKVIEHFRLVGEVDLSYPTILGPDNRVMDGMHRVARALLDGRTAIRAKRVRELPEPDYADAVRTRFRTEARRPVLQVRSPGVEVRALGSVAEVQAVEPLTFKPAMVSVGKVHREIDMSA
jgi:hypothetical protein